MKLKTTILMLVLFTMLCGAALTIQAQNRGKHVVQEEKSFQVSGVPRLDASTFDGSIRIESWSKSEVLCRIEKRGRSQADTDRIEILSNQTGNEIRLEVKVHERGLWNGWASAHLTVYLPRQASVNARTGDGSIEARGLNGDVELQSGDGSITVSDVSGNLKVQTGDGSMNLSDVRGRLRAVTGDGRIQARGRFTDLEAKTGDGSMDIAVESGSQMDTPWVLRTGDGSILLGLPDDFSAELDVFTGDGSISTDVPVTISGKLGNSLKGRLNQGGKLLTVRTGDGSVTLRRN